MWKWWSVVMASVTPPGHTAKNLSYFLMELVSDYILDVEVRDKRHVGLASTNMERQALQNALQRLRSSINIVEVVIDASTSLKKMIGKIQFTCNLKCSWCLQLICQIHAHSTINFMGLVSSK